MKRISPMIESITVTPGPYASARQTEPRGMPKTRVAIRSGPNSALSCLICAASPAAWPVVWLWCQPGNRRPADVVAAANVGERFLAPGAALDRGELGRPICARGRGCGQRGETRWLQIKPKAARGRRKSGADRCRQHSRLTVRRQSGVQLYHPYHPSRRPGGVGRRFFVAAGLASAFSPARRLSSRRPSVRLPPPLPPPPFARFPLCGGDLPRRLSC
jgi:hypothetical protein